MVGEDGWLVGEIFGGAGQVRDRIPKKLMNMTTKSIFNYISRSKLNHRFNF